MSKLAVIDLGTNTFHLLIVETTPNGSFEEVYRKSTFVQLAETGIQTIGTAPFKRGLTTMSRYQEMLSQHQVDQCKAFGTAALRTASNGKYFIDQVQALTGIEVELISGEEEARLIHQGVIRAIPFGEEKNLIIDIGGGSVEFIIADQHQVFWAQSFPIGIAVLYKEWQKSDPITEANVLEIKDFFTRQLFPLLEILKKHHTPNLIGASGAFDVLQFFLCPEEIDFICSSIPTTSFYPFYHQMLKKSLPERFEMEGLPREKAEMIVVAFVLIDFILEKAGAKTILISSYALKEGVLAEMTPDF